MVVRSRPERPAGFSTGCRAERCVPMRGKFSLLWMALVAGTLLVPLAAQGQQPPLRESPNGLWSPSYRLLQPQPAGPLSRLFDFRREQQLQQNLRSQQYQMQRQGTAIQGLQNQWLAPQRDGASLAPTGRGSRFMDHSHFYPGLSGNR